MAGEVNLTTITEAVNALGVVGLLALAIYGKFKGWWYTASEYKSVTERLSRTEEALASLTEKYEHLLATVVEMKGVISGGTSTGCTQ